MAFSPEFQEFIDDLCRSSDISSIAAEHGVNVKRSGNNYSCCCPFHGEKTPSCYLYTEDNHYHCFGCGAHGSVIKFVMQVENIGFMEAVDILASRLGMTVPRGKGNNPRSKYSKGKSDFQRSGFSANAEIVPIELLPENIPEENIPPEKSHDIVKTESQKDLNIENTELNQEVPIELQFENIPIENIPEDRSVNIPPENIGSGYDGYRSRTQRIYDMNKEAGRFFHNMLLSPEGREGLEYFTRRGLSLETINKFGLGYAPNDYHKLHYYMKSLGYTDNELKECALITTRDGRNFYDKFRNRVMFPVFDERKRVIAFGGRILSDDKKAPKYLNSDETPVFQKRKTLFALDRAKKSQADYFIICEGYMDVISMHQAGFDSAVASLGTAITREQADLLSKRGKKKVVLSYDSDGAGQRATSKAIGLFMQTAFEKVSVLKISGAKDPDEFIKNFGAEPFKQLIEQSEGAVAFEMARLSAGLDMKNPDDKNVFIRRAVRFIAETQDPAFRETCAEKAAIMGDVSKSAVMEGVNALLSERRIYSHISPLDNADIDAQNEYSEGEHNGRDNAETAILSYLFHNQSELIKNEDKLSDGLLSEEGEKIYRFLLENCKGNSADCEISALYDKFPEEKGRITQIAGKNIFAYNEVYFKEALEKLTEIKRGFTNVHSFADLSGYINYKQNKGDV